MLSDNIKVKEDSEKHLPIDFYYCTSCNVFQSYTPKILTKKSIKYIIPGSIT